jgi:uroporphyrinogen decarboxylase
VSIFIQALRGVRTERTPVWFMRQAGRYMAEYRELRAKYSMLDVVRTPEFAAEVTMQPLRRFDLDAGIIFADILTPLIGMGAQLDFKKGEGPVIDNPVRTRADVDALLVPSPEENVGYTLEAIKLVVSMLKGRLPLIGFSGAPFTLSCYLIEGESPGDLSRTKAMMYGDSTTWHALQEKLVPLVSDYLVAQAEAGAEALQLFDSWLGYLGPAAYEEFVAPYLQRIVADVKSRTTAPLVLFSTGTAGLYSRLGKLPVDGFGIDWRVTLTDAATLLGRPAPLQGNLDPQLLLGPWEPIERAARSILEQGRSLPAHVFNLGHGILPPTPLENVERLITLVHSSVG